MKISVFGLGYVGTVCAGCLADDGHEVIGVDVSGNKVELINSGRSPIIEREIGEIVAATVASGRLRATADAGAAIAASELSMICVGTPSQSNGSLDLSHVAAVCDQIGAALANKPQFHVVVVRSTMLPGSVREVVVPHLERASGKKMGAGFGLCINPEFMREGTAVWDFRNPPKTVIGESDPASGDVLLKLYEQIEAPLVRTEIETAEMVKYCDNTWHALKVAFANEVGNLCKSLDIDGRQVMEIFCKDRKLNLSPYYLKPGFAFGGSCLPKDVRALTHKGRALDLELPVLNAILPSNRLQTEKGIAMALQRGHRRIGVLGFAFKAGTDDLRESPMVGLIEHLLGKGCELRIYDRNVRMAALTGANRDFILNRIPHIAGLMVDSIDEVMGFAQTIVVGNGDEGFRSALDRVAPEQTIVDLVGFRHGRSAGNYDGIGW